MAWMMIKNGNVASSLREKHKHPCSSDFCFAAIMLNKHANHHMHVTTFHAKTVQTCVHACYIFFYGHLFFCQQPLMAWCMHACDSLPWLDAHFAMFIQVLPMCVNSCHSLHGLMLTLPCLLRFCPCVYIHATACMAWFCSTCFGYPPQLCSTCISKLFLGWLSLINLWFCKTMPKHSTTLCGLSFIEMLAVHIWFATQKLQMYTIIFFPQ